MLLIDLQVGTARPIETRPPGTTRRNGVAPARVARTLDIPVVITTSVEERAQGDVSPGLRDAAPETFESRVNGPGVSRLWRKPRESVSRASLAHVSNM